MLKTDYLPVFKILLFYSCITFFGDGMVALSVMSFATTNISVAFPQYYVEAEYYTDLSSPSARLFHKWVALAYFTVTKKRNKRIK